MFSICLSRFFRFRLRVIAVLSLFYLLLLFVSLSNASSFRWKLVAYDDSAKYFINIDQIEHGKDTVSFWLKTEHDSGKLTSVRYRMFCRYFEFRKERAMIYEDKRTYKKDFSMSEPRFIDESPIMRKCFELFCGEKVEVGDSNGRLKEQGWIYRPEEGKEDVKVGRWTYWYDNGFKREELFFKDGKKEGTWTFWSRDGKKWKQQHYKNDVLDGLWITWHSNGKKSMERSYVNGRLDGKFTQWNKHGEIIQESWYKDGKPLRPPKQ